MARVMEALKRKLGPQPAWAWLSELAGGLYLYRKHQAASAAATTGTGATAQTVPASSDYYSSWPSGAGGGGGGAPAQPSSDTTGPGTPVVYDPTTDSYQPSGDHTNPLQPAPTGDGTTTTTTTTGGGGGNPNPWLPPASRPRGKLSQSVAHPVAILPAGHERPGAALLWGGQTIVSKRQFQDWARAHGTTVQRILSNHPGARQIYDQLPAGGMTITPAGYTGRTPPAKAAPRSAPTTAPAAPASRPRPAPTLVSEHGQGGGYTPAAKAAAKAPDRALAAAAAAAPARATAAAREPATTVAGAATRPGRQL